MMVGVRLGKDGWHGAAQKQTLKRDKNVIPSTTRVVELEGWAQRSVVVAEMSRHERW